MLSVFFLHPPDWNPRNLEVGFEGVIHPHVSRLKLGDTRLTKVSGWGRDGSTRPIILVVRDARTPALTSNSLLGQVTHLICGWE